MFNSYSLPSAAGVGKRVKPAAWYADEELKARIESTMSPSMLHGGHRSFLSGARSDTPQPQSSTSMPAQNARPSSAAASFANLSDHIKEGWRQPQQALERLIDRTHRQQLERSLGANHPLVAHHGGSAAAAVSAMAGNPLHARGGMSSMRRIHAVAAHTGSAASAAAAFQRGGIFSDNPGAAPVTLLQQQQQQQQQRLDPMTEMDRLYSRAKRKWIELCVTMRVPEPERELIEKQIAKRDSVAHMTNALSLLHGEIERLMDLFKWTSELRSAIEAREAKLAAFFGFLTKYRLSPHTASTASTATASSPSSSPSALSGDECHKLPPLPPAEQRADVCMRVLQRLLELRHASAVVYTAHRKWQVAHGTTAPHELFVHRGCAYLEKMLNDVSCGLVDTDALDIDRAIALQNERLKMSGAGSAAGQSAGANSVKSKTASGSGVRAVKANRGNNNIYNGIPSPSPSRSPARRRSVAGASADVTSVVEKLPDWLFSFVHFRVARSNVLLDTRKRRVMFQNRTHQLHLFSAADGGTSAHNSEQYRTQTEYESSEAFRPERELIRQYAQGIHAACAAADDKLEKFLLERCNWTIDDYYKSGHNALAEVKAAWKFVAEALQRSATQRMRNPAELGTVRSEFIKELEQQCAFVLEHESTVVDKLIARSMPALSDGVGSMDGADKSLVRMDGSIVLSQPEQVRCIIKVQSVVRRFLARARTRRLWERKVAATVIQSWMRRHLAKLRLQKRRREWRAVTKIQAFFRATMIRRHIRSELAERREAHRRLIEQQYLDSKRATDAQKTMDASRILVLAGKIISVSPTRKMLHGMAKGGPSLRHHLARCATCIQAAWRGFAVRRRGEVREWRLFLALNRAAAKIQAAWRGAAVHREYMMTRMLKQTAKLLQRVGRGYTVRRGGHRRKK